MIHGKCACEQVEYQVEGELGPVFNCHCLKCRRWHGAAYRTRAPIRREQLRFTAGEQHLAFFYSSPGIRKYFCRHCGSPLHSSYDNAPDMFGMPLGGLEGLDEIDLKGHIFTGSKAPWLQIQDDKPCYDEFPDRPGAVMGFD